MNPLGGLSAFFYNIIPGVLFLLVLGTVTTFPQSEVIFKDISSGNLERIFWIIAISLFLGFLVQAFAKLTLKDKINVVIFKEIKENNSEAYEKVFERLKLYGIIKNDLRVGNVDEKVLLGIFYSMDNYLRNSGACYVINHFAERAAFWLNISVGSFILSIIVAKWPKPTILNFYGIFILGLFFLGILSLCYFVPKSMKSQYESVLQTYVQSVDSKSRSSKK